MTLQDKVNLTFWASDHAFTVITSREQAEAFKAEWLSGTLGKISVSGNYNNADANPIELSYDLATIDGLQIMELNKF